METNIKPSVFDPSAFDVISSSSVIEEEEEVNSTKNRIKENFEQIKEKFENKTLFQIYDPETENEYYTYDKLEIDKNILQATNVIQKKILEENVIKQVLQVFFSYTSEDLKIKKFNLFKGVVIKVYTEDLLKDWLTINEQTAKELLKEKTLQAYKNLMPNLINKIETLENQIQRKEKVKNKISEEDEDITLMKL